ncbi:MAG TPA: class I SAM-dependent methyltransferase [Propionicimonas sp.]|nr:class I SAM-dependent methyltransferase [Propionicimonas sp.]HRA07062.1 class I SAM-dependent methyltransferase [Propionicimonas sp.]
MTATGPESFWEERYAGKPQVWSGRVNRVLAELFADLPPGRALDLGCGEGGDAIWLAEHGWTVTAVDISTTAIERGRRAATGLADPIDWVVADLGEWTTNKRFDLVVSSFLQSPIELPRASILRAAAALVAPAGRLLVVAHAAPPPWASQLHDHHEAFLTPAAQVAELDLDDSWKIEIAEVRSRPATGPDGEAAELEDSVVLVTRS